MLNSRSRWKLRLLIVLCLLQGSHAWGQTPAENLRQAEFADVLSGEKFRLADPAESLAVVLIFLGHECPISNSYAKEIGRLCEEFAPQKVTFCVVYAEADLSSDDARQHAQEYGFPCPALLDPSFTLAREVGATIKPEVALLSPKLELLYRGRIDNRYLDFGKRREQVTSHDLREALQAVLAQKPIANRRTTAIGCDIDFPQQPVAPSKKGAESPCAPGR